MPLHDPRRARKPPSISANLLIDVGPAVGGHGQRGIGRYVRGLAASIATFPDDLKNRIWALGFSGPTLDSFGSRAIPFTADPWLGLAPQWATRRLAVGAALKRSGACALHATDPQRPWNKRSVPSLVTVYDLIPLREREMVRSWRLDHRLVYRWYLRSVESADRTLAISRATAADVQERLGIPAERIDIVYPLVGVPSGAARAEPAEPTFLFVGALAPHKQPELTLQAFALFHSRFGSGHLRYVGPSDDAQERRLHDLAARLGVYGFVSIEGRIAEDELEHAYATATALVSTSRVEGFGLPPVEAALRGLPVIAVQSTAAAETLDGVATLVPADAEAIADAMAHPMEPTEFALAVLRERHSIASVARSLEASYRRMID